MIYLLFNVVIFLSSFIKFRIDEMSERIDDLESTVTKLVEESNQNQIGNNNNDMNQQWNKYKNWFEKYAFS